MLIFGAPTEPFSELEFNSLQTFLEDGGNLLFLVNEEGEEK